MPVSVWMKRLAVLQVTRHCDFSYCHPELAEKGAVYKVILD